MQEDGVLYHYTSLEAFSNIIKTKEFRLFDITKSNDPLEGEYMLRALKNTCNFFSFPDSGLTEDQYRLARRALFVFEQEIYGRSRFKDFFASASFCIPHHQLMMLRSYADNGRGVSVGVTRTTLENLAEKIPNIEFKKVQYLSEGDMKNRAIDFWIDTVSNLKNTENDDIDNEDLTPIIEAIKKEFEEGLFIKGKPNEDEEEYRLLYHCKDLFALHLPKVPVDIPEKVNFAISRDDIKAYYKIPLGTEEKDLFHFQNVFLGPLCKATPDEMQVFLQKNGFFLNAISEIPDIYMR